MTVLVSSRFSFALAHPASVLLQFEAADFAGQEVIDAATHITPAGHFSRVSAQDDIGTRIWLHAQGRVEVEYQARVAARRKIADLTALDAVPLHRLPGPAVKFLFDSRYCHSSQFVEFSDQTFGDLQGGARAAAIRDWIHANIDYVPGASNVSTTATDTFHAHEGICRDFTHLFVTLARAAAIPARYVACYAPGVTPQDFHALAAVYLAHADGADEEGDPGAEPGSWQLVDATGMADLANTAIIGVGRDAADVSFITSFAPMQFEMSRVEVSLEA
ncbi:transglutaminase-like domain-containing protein [Qipengyuania sp. ASV99]|uniref:transglutaminase-like domain-containing protein n=1 Tax=Qipengyuania sp. ASV99 TaxID=3399681 RepID=UPI003A4C529E